MVTIEKKIRGRFRALPGSLVGLGHAQEQRKKFPP